MEYVISVDGSAESVYYICASGYSPDVQVSVSGSSTDYTYLLKDNLGSPLVVVNDAGNVFDSQARYDPWGAKVLATGVAKTTLSQEVDEKTRGYTGHELIASANMGHWNGRPFDYEIGAFPGPDKMI